ncbi:MAG: peptidoglycan-associated lipoprotein Pal [Methylococcaceae bacterium]
MKSKLTLLALLISTLLLSACSDEEKDTSLTDGSQNEIIGVNDASTSGLNDGSRLSGSEMGGGSRRMNGGGGRNGASNLGPEFNDPNNPLSKRTIYFMLNSSQVQEDFIAVIAAHAQYLVANPGQRVLLEGNADERGSREYNIALGEGRAKSVANMFKMQGVSESQIDIVSYGEEKPAAMGNDEAAWELNRRVEVVYK